MQVELYDAKNVDLLQWPDTPDGRYAQQYLTPLIINGVNNYIDNVHADMLALKIEDFIFPVIVVHEEKKNSYICSPHEHYIAYGKDSIGLIGNKMMAVLVRNLLEGFGKLGKFGKINSVVYVNHWLFSTDLYPAGLTAEHLSTIAHFLQQRYPTRAIIFRSLNNGTTASVQLFLKQAGYRLIASRQIHVTDASNEQLFQTRIIKSDLKLWNNKPFTVLDESQFSEKECADLLKLYNMLYIEQHSARNPHYNQNFVEHLFKNKLLHFRVLKDGANFKGVAGFYIKNGVMMCPFFGYDKTDPQQTVIYRMLSTALLLAAKERGLLFNQSAGASFYKSIRRSQSCKESMAIYSKHLPFKQKIAWSMLRTFVNLFAPRYMKKY